MKRLTYTADQAHQLYKLNKNLSKVNESKLNSLVEHALKDLIAEQQVSTKQIIDALFKSTFGPGTDEEGLVAAVKMIPDYRTLQQVDSILKAGAERAAEIGPNSMFSLSNGSRVNTSWSRSFGNNAAEYYSVRKIIDGEFGIGDDSYKREALSHLSKITKPKQSTTKPGAFPPPSIQAISTLTGAENYIKFLINNGYINAQDFKMWVQSIKDLESVYDSKKVDDELEKNIPIWRSESVLDKNGRTRTFNSAGGLGVKETVNVKRVFRRYWLEKVSKQNPEFQSTMIQIPGLSKPMNEILDFIGSFIGPQALPKDIIELTAELSSFLKTSEGRQAIQICEELYSLLTDNSTPEIKYPQSKLIDAPELVIIPTTEEKKSSNETAEAYVTAIENALKSLASGTISEQAEFVTASSDSSQVIIDFGEIEKKYNFTTMEALRDPNIVGKIAEQYRKALATTKLYADSPNRDELLEATALCIVSHVSESGDTVIRSKSRKYSKTTLPISAAEILKLLDDTYNTNADNKQWWNSIKSTIQQQNDFKFAPAERTKLIQNIQRVIAQDPDLETEFEKLEEKGFGLVFELENFDKVMESFGNGGIVQDIYKQLKNTAIVVGVTVLVAIAFIEVLAKIITGSFITPRLIKGLHGFGQDVFRQIKWINMKLLYDNPKDLARFLSLLQAHQQNRMTPILQKELIKLGGKYGYKISRKGTEDLVAQIPRRYVPTNLMQEILKTVETNAQIQSLFQQALNITITRGDAAEYRVVVEALKKIADNPKTVTGGYFFKIRPRVPLEGKKTSVILPRNVADIKNAINNSYGAGDTVEL